MSEWTNMSESRDNFKYKFKDLINKRQEIEDKMVVEFGSYLSEKVSELKDCLNEHDLSSEDSKNFSEKESFEVEFTIYRYYESDDEGGSEIRYNYWVNGISDFEYSDKFDLYDQSKQDKISKILAEIDHVLYFDKKLAEQIIENSQVNCVDKY
jgi:hypothetical protein